MSASSLVEDEIEYIERFESEMLLRVSIRVGTRFPAHCTATGKVLLAALSDAGLTQLYRGRGRLKKCTAASITSMRELKKALEKVREQGFARDSEETLIGVNCVASPIYNLKGEVVAAISISGPRERMTPEKGGGDDAPFTGNQPQKFPGSWKRRISTHIPPNSRPTPT